MGAAVAWRAGRAGAAALIGAALGAGGCALLAAMGDVEVAEVLAHTRAARSQRR